MSTKPKKKTRQEYEDEYNANGFIDVPGFSRIAPEHSPTGEEDYGVNLPVGIGSAALVCRITTQAGKVVWKKLVAVVLEKPKYSEQLWSSEWAEDDDIPADPPPPPKPEKGQPSAQPAAKPQQVQTAAGQTEDVNALARHLDEQGAQQLGGRIDKAAKVIAAMKKQLEEQGQQLETLGARVEELHGRITTFLEKPAAKPENAALAKPKDDLPF